MDYQDFDYYEALGVDSSADEFQIRKAYHKISKTSHPDKALKFNDRQIYDTLKKAGKEGTELSESDKKLLDKFEQIIKPFSKAAIAYETLSDSQERKKYDEYKGVGKSGSASDPGKSNGYGKKEETKKSYQAPKTNKKKDIVSDLLGALYYKDLKKAKGLVRELNDLGELHILSSMLHSFVENACNNDDWFEFFEEILSYKNIDLETTFFSSTALQHACHLNNIKVAELLLKNGVNVNGIDFSKEIVPIYHALKHNNCDLVNLLFQYGAKINVNKKVEQKIIANSHLYNKKTIEALLQYTSPQQNIQIFKQLFKNKAPTDKDNEILKLLLDKGVNRVGVELYEALCNQDLKTARELIKKIESSSTCFTNDPEILGRFVERACESNDWFNLFEEVLSCKEIKIDLDVKTQYCRGTTLQYACRLKKKDVAKLLLDNGANINEVVDDRTAIFFAALRCKTQEEVEFVKLLLNKGADPYLGRINARMASHNNKELEALFSQNCESRLSEALKSRNLETVENLIGYAYVTFASQAQLAQEHLYYFTKNACENDDWFNYFQNLIHNKKVKINLDVDIGPDRALDYAIRHNMGRRVAILLVMQNIGNKLCDNNIGSIINFITTLRDKIIQSPPTKEIGSNLEDMNAARTVTQANYTEIQNLQKNIDKSAMEVFSSQDQQPIGRFVHENVNYAYYNTSARGNNCLLHALCGDVSKGSAVAVHEEGRAEKMREEIKDFIETGYKKLVEGNILELVEAFNSYFNVLPPEYRKRDIEHLKNGEQLHTELIPIIMLLRGIEKLTLFNCNVETHNIFKHEYILPGWIFDQVDKNKEVWGDSNVKECTIFREGNEFGGHFNRVEVVSLQEHTHINGSSEYSIFNKNQNCKEPSISADNEQVDAGVDNHKTVSSSTNAISIGGVFSHGPILSTPETDIGIKTKREVCNEETERLQIEKVIEYQKQQQAIDKSSVHEQNTKQIPTNPTSTIKDSGLPGCKASAVPTEHGTTKIYTTARSDSENKVINHQKQTFIKTCSTFDSNQKEIQQDNQDVVQNLQSGSSTPISGKKIPGSHSTIFSSKHKEKIALGVAGLCIVGAVVAFLLECPIVVVAVFTALAAAILMVIGIAKACLSTEKSDVPISNFASGSNEGLKATCRLQENGVFV